MNKSTATHARCAICNGRIERVALQYGRQSVGRGWIHRGAQNALRAQVEMPHAAAPSGHIAQKGTPNQMATTARRAAAKPAARTTTRAAAKSQPAKAAPVAAKRSTKKAAQPVRGAKSEAMREMFREGATVSEVAKAVGAHYSFAHGVYTRMVEAGEDVGEATTPREAKAKPAAKAKASAKSSAKQSGRPTAARRAANRKPAPEPEVEDEDLEDEDLDLDEEEYEEEE